MAAELFIWQGVLYKKRDTPDMARKESYPMADSETDKEELYDQAIDLFADDKFDEAIAMYERALEIDPKFTDAVHGLAMCYQAKGDTDSAIEVTKRHIAADPEDILAF